MSKKVDSMIAEYVETLVRDIHRSGYAGINAVERIIRDPGIATDRSQHRILWWPKNRRCAKVSKAFHQIDVISRVVLIIHYKGVITDDGKVFTKHDLAKNSSIGVRRFNEILKKSKNKIADILAGYDRLGFNF